MKRVNQFAILAAAVLVCGLLVAQDKKPPQEQERKVKEAEVPAAALTSLKKLAGGAAITEFAEEIEHGHTFYEGSWKAADGANVDAVVTPTGDVVEVEEIVPTDKVPGGVRAAVEKEAGKDAKLGFEKITLYLYEVHFKKDGKGRELVFTADGRRFHEEQEEGDQDEDEKD